MFNMNTAPKDGTRILALTKLYGYDSRKRQYAETGTQIVEIHWSEYAVTTGWSEWLGRPEISSTAPCDPIGWWPKSLLPGAEHV